MGLTDGHLPRSNASDLLRRNRPTPAFSGKRLRASHHPAGTVEQLHAVIGHHGQRRVCEGNDDAGAGVAGILRKKTGRALSSSQVVLRLLTFAA